MARFGRFAISSGLALGITFGLFFLMHSLVAMGSASLEKEKEIRVMDFVRVKRSRPIKEKKRELPSRPQANDAPPTPNMNMSSPSVGGGVDVGAMPISAPSSDMPVKMRKTPKLGRAPVSDRSAVPLVRIEPQYPVRAAQDGIEGYVRMRFDIDPDGNVTNVTVLDAQPRDVFERAATRAMKKWRYRPKVVNGKGRWVRGKVVRMPFKLRN